VISKKWKSRIALLVHNALGLCSDGYRQDPARLALPEMRPTLFEKSRGEFLNWMKHKQILKVRNTKTSKLQPKNWQDRACRIELADLGNFLVKSILPPT